MPTIDITTIGNNPKFTDRDPDSTGETQVTSPHADYPTWRKMFNGEYLKEETPDSPDPETGEPIYRWPVRFNLFKAYAMTHAAMLWGRGETGREADNLFDIYVEPEVPGQAYPSLVAAAPAFQDNLKYWWSFNTHILRPCGATQQWAGGCIVKISWNPAHPDAVYGTIAEIIEPEHFFPVPDPLNWGTLLAARIKFKVDVDVAMAKYCLTADQARRGGDGDGKIQVEEYWDRFNFHIKVGKGDNSFTARLPRWDGTPGERLAGPNPWKHPVTQVGVIPIVYIPRLRTAGFWGDSFVMELEGLVREINKTLADIGDAVTGATHFRGVVADDNFDRGVTKSGQSRYINMPKDGLFNLGRTPPGGTQGRYWDVKPPDVPAQTPQFMDQMLSMAEHAGQLTPAARGAGSSGSAASGFSKAMEMLPTTNLIDWARSHWARGIAGKQGIHQILGVIWWVKGQYKEARQLNILPPMTSFNVLRCRQEMSFRPVIPKDRVAVIQEVTQLVANKIIGPREALRRLGDVKDVPEALDDLWFFLMWMASVDAAVAGHGIKWSGERNVEDGQPPEPVPELTGETAEESPKQPAKQPEGQKKE